MENKRLEKQLEFEFMKIERKSLCKELFDNFYYNIKSAHDFLINCIIPQGLALGTS